MSNPVTPPSDVSSDDRLWALLAYLLTPLIPIIILFMEDKKNRPFIKAHNVQALALGVVLYAINAVVSAITMGIGGCITGIATIVIVIMYGVKANKGEVFEIPVITDFVKKQGWA